MPHCSLDATKKQGLRCVYHGWKFDVDGNCVDMPSEPAESNFKNKVHATAYPTIERGGLIWAYMGPRESMPELPPYEWTRVPEGHVRTSRRLQECNYLQGIEGGIDSSHVPFLHGVLDPERQAAPNQKYLYADTAPRLQVTPTDYGFAYGAQRNGEDSSYYWRLTPFLMPFFTVIPGFTVTPDQKKDDAHTLTYSGHGWVPRDDHSCWMVTYSWNASRRLEPGEGHPAHLVNLDERTLRADVNSDNDYGIDRDVQRTPDIHGHRQRLHPGRRCTGEHGQHLRSLQRASRYFGCGDYLPAQAVSSGGSKHHRRQGAVHPDQPCGFPSPICVGHPG